MTRATSSPTTKTTRTGGTTMSAAAAIPTNTAGHLRRLYFVRFLFAAAWAGTFAAIGSSLDPGSITLLILYPAFDVAAAAFDVRSSRNPVLYVNMAISTAATIGLAFAAADDIPAVLRVWGVWAIVAGLVQLFVALKRRALGGQWAMILSGSISVIAGGGFLRQASSATSMKICAGYAALGGLFFLISAVRLLRARNTSTSNTTKLSEAR
jgi:uncharacterized membrane protein HdeD (DUF308 family)